MATDTSAPPVRRTTDDDLAAGLDALETPVESPRTSAWRATWRAVWPVLSALGAILVVWQVAYLLDLKPSYALPSPADTWRTLLGAIQDGSAWRAVTLSVQRAAVGFAMSVVVGVAIGVALAASPLLRRAFGPIITGLQSLPSVAWVPAAIIWFQLTDATMYAVILLGAVPSIVNGLLAGTDQVPPLYLRVGQVLGATGWARIRFVLLPAALPGFLGGLKQGWAFAWRSLMAAELIVQTGLGTGLGQILDLGRVTSDMSLVIASIGLIFLVGIVIELVVFAPLERHVLHARGLTGRTSTT
ncbi:ABC transporter permease [Cellulomonas fengjieae]|uniref:ABC transporter permease n=1 Tax=Cellulomonas fengjieae TaxID=2819978 RepID=A0ABS3SJ79_9CELL|nr:ABC transporter permease [Cellulomonas fengjieae]MBO3085809.1 ABC transporter permease [Cellulomonas fengjieae]MBO3102919.1 ABC transporter permease [Cellulomonas fengjieae]QVI67488.1 ABC transporter permease [Cellulomonas fengjieae]